LAKIAESKLTDDGVLEIYPFSNLVRKRKTFGKEKLKDLADYLVKELAYDGATRLDSFKLHVSKTSPLASFVLMFTDGMSTAGT